MKDIWIVSSLGLLFVYKCFWEYLFSFLLGKYKGGESLGYTISVTGLTL